MTTSGAKDPSVVYVQAVQADGFADHNVMKRSLSEKDSFAYEFKSKNPKVKLENPCSVTLHEYGEGAYFVNGKPYVKGNSEPIPIKSVDDLLDSLPGLAVRNKMREGCHVRLVHRLICTGCARCGVNQ